MIVEKFHYTMKSGWSVDSFPALDGKQTLLLLFGATQYTDAPDPIKQLRQAYPNSHLIGCSTSGEIDGTLLRDDSLVVAVVQFAQTELQVVATENVSAESSYDSGLDLAQQLNRPNLRGIFILSDGLNINGTQLVNGFNTILPPSIPITGGLAGDRDRFARTWTLYNDKIAAQMIVAVGFYGEAVTIRHGSKGGWNIFGPERLITRSEGNILYELDGHPALELYKNYLGERAAGLPATALLFPLSVRQDIDTDRYVVRTILAIDEEKQAMIFAGDIPHGYRAQLMRANFDNLIDGAESAAEMTDPAQHENPPVLSIAISCVGRRLVLGQRTEEELEATLETLPDETVQVGFYSYGELSPYLPTNDYCDLQNQTMTLTTISEQIIDA